MKVKDLTLNAGFMSSKEKAQLEEWASSLHPIWEMRYSEHCPPPPGDWQRPLLRPVYWLGNWQFACLGYYEPPKGILNRAVKAEPFPHFLQAMVSRIHEQAHRIYKGDSMPKGWELNTCLVNYYGDALLPDGKRDDRARVGEHKDFEPGPVASISLGERAMFQFVTGKPKAGIKDNVIHQEWLGHGSLLLFGGKKWKEQCFHRVQRVDDKTGWRLKSPVQGFETRRLNLTFRYVPREHWVDYKDLPAELAQDVRPYMQELAMHSDHFKKALGDRG